MKDRVITAVKKMKKEQWIVCGLAGLLLLVVALPVKKADPKTDAKNENGEQPDQNEMAAGSDIRMEYEQQLTQALSKVQGVGSVQVVITMESTGRKIVEKDSPTDMESTTQKDGEGLENDSQSTSSQETTVFEETDDGSQIPYVASETYPEIRGVLVIAEGGDDPVLVQQIQEAVMALFHVEAHKIKVLKMK
ncbi:MAG: stage III sporulation protein AG [Clostridia bacterium]|nr:stage III sporulation protein AG [Clostridia bacterium]NCC44911.1 stage III sporulation protein AG [Clostridia bacterium]